MAGLRITGPDGGDSMEVPQLCNDREAVDFRQHAALEAAERPLAVARVRDQAQRGFRRIVAS
jgi:hypothetical protein